MQFELKPGTYVVAVSGGVDSVALLHMLATNHRAPKTKFVVAHFDHGIRTDSALDRRLVEAQATDYGLPFVYQLGNLGHDSGELAARRARYAFLHKVKRASGAHALITAHHQDDVLETAILNMLRGTGPRGLTSLDTRPHIQRPLLDVPKADLIAYAKDQGLRWREDTTNTNLRYLRNYIRHRIVPRFSEADKQTLLRHIRQARVTRKDLEQELTNHLHLHPRLDRLDRHWFVMLPHAVAREVLATWLRRHGVQDITSKMIERLVVAAKTFTPGQVADIDKSHVLRIENRLLALVTNER